MPLTTACQIVENLDKFFSNNYLDRCQVATPLRLVKWTWEMVHSRRQEKFNYVLDLGCGDGRFSLYGKYSHYHGIEIDKEHRRAPNIPKNVKIIHGCALLTPCSKYDICIGNPPYVRHHDMDSTWQQSVASYLSELLGTPIDLRANAFMYFMAKALLSASENGLVALIVPYEWVSRPSTKWIRDYILENRWSVDVYRLPEGVFPRVLTTSCLTIIDKSIKDSRFRYFEVDHAFNAKPTPHPSGTTSRVLEYTHRNAALYAQRGLSPGTQKVFCLTEEERIYNNLKVGRDVSRCVTSLKNLPPDWKVLSEKRFWRYFVEHGARCWLIRSDKEKLSSALQRYLETVDSLLRDTSTCRNREVWYRFPLPEPPALLFSTGFVKHGPLVLENPLGVIHVGGVAGIYGERTISFRKIASELRKYNFERRVVNHSNILKKLEINQMNTVLNVMFGKLYDETD